MELEKFNRNIVLNLGKEIFFNIDNTIKQGKIISISPNYLIELDENKKKIQYTFSNIFDFIVETVFIFKPNEFAISLVLYPFNK